MLRELRRRKQQIADKIGHEEYIYRLNGDPFSGQEEIRVRPQGNFDPRRGAGARGDVHRPPYAVDDDYGNNRGNGHPVAPLNPITGAPAAWAGGGGNNNNNNNNGGALIPIRNDNNANRNFASPYGPPARGNGNNNGGGGYAAAPQPIVSAFGPVLPPMSPVGELPGPLPPVYRPKPPLTFHTNGAGPSFPPPQLYYPGGGGAYDGAPAAPLPSYGLPQGGREDGTRPNTSPSTLPPLTPSGEGAINSNAADNHVGRSARPNTGGAAAVGNLIIGSSGLSDVEERHREKMAARQRAIELQQENARQMLEQQQRKQAEREREMREDREAENRLRREREEVARREQAEIDREIRERELKMMGPQAAQEALERHRKETEARREAEAAARRNKGRLSQPQQNEAEPAAGAAQTAADEAVDPPQKDKSSAADAAPAKPQPTPLGQRAPINFTSAFYPPPPSTLPMEPGVRTTQQYFTNVGLGGNGLTPPPPSPTPAPLYYAAPYAMQQRQQSVQLESDAIQEELRRITFLLEAQQLTHAMQHNTSPPPWMAGPRPSSAAGAGTYLTTGLPSPTHDVSNASNVGGGAGLHLPGTGRLRDSPLPPTSSVPYASNGGSPYRSFLAGGSLPPPPLATAVPPLPSALPSLQHTSAYSASSHTPGDQGGPWQGLFSASAHRSYGHSHFGGSYPGDGADPEELAIEPSKFVMPAAASPVAFTPATAPSAPPHLTTGTAADAAAAAAAAMGGPSALLALGDFAYAAQSGPAERPGTGKPATSPSPVPPSAAGLLEEKPRKSNASPATVRVSFPSAAPDAVASVNSGLAPAPVSAMLSDSPVRCTTPCLMPEGVVNAGKTKSPETDLPLTPSPRRPRASAMEPPVVVLAPTLKKAEYEDEL